MAKLTKIKDTRLKNPVQYRLRYTIYFPDGGRRDRSRRYRTSVVARGKQEVATVLENRTRQLLQTSEEIQVWLNEGLISAEEVELLDPTPLAHKKTLREAMEEYQKTWDVSPGEVATRLSRIQIIEEILGADTAIFSLHYGDGEALKVKLKARDLKVVTIRKYLQDLTRCFRHQVRLRILPYNPFTELAAGRVPPEERPVQVRLSSAQVIEVIKKAAERLTDESGWAVLGGWLDVCLIEMFRSWMEKHGTEWAHKAEVAWHFYGGMALRNHLREGGHGEKEIGIENLDFIYIRLIERAVLGKELERDL